jgi:DNA-binding CsgD family transcriptional regulator
LSTREAEILMWVARGKCNKEIGRLLGLSPRTVGTHPEHIYQKLGVKNRLAAVTLVLRGARDKDFSLRSK